jgi:phosphoribosyl 1,2-cyclic phosphate phosphodiesterase
MIRRETEPERLAAMRLTFLGTSGSEGYPAAFCACPRCEAARTLGGKNIRRRSSLLLNDDLLLDLGPDVPGALQALGLSLARLRYALITHAHDDHFVPIQLKYRHARYGAVSLPPLTVFGSPPSLARLDELPMSIAELGVSARPVVAGEWVDAGPYRVLPLAARHAPGLEALVYVVSRGDIAVLYATDTGALPDATLRRLEGHRLKTAVFDATFWSGPSDDDHLNLDQVVDLANTLRGVGALDEHATVVATHLSHRSQPDHATLERRLAGTGVIPAFDGLSLDLAR